MQQADHIRFDLTGVDMDRAMATSIRNISSRGEPLSGYTNFELALIRSNPGFLGKTTFYRNGVQVTPRF